MTEKTKNSLGITLQSMFLGLGLYFFGRVFRNGYYYPFIEKTFANNQVVYEIFRYLGHVFFLIPLIIYLLLVKEDSYLLKEFKFEPKGKNIKLILLGLLIGFLENGVCILAAYLHGDIDMVPASFDIGLLIFMFIAIAFQSSTEEFQNRIWTQGRIQNKADLKYAVIGSALAFALTHMLNPGISLIALINIFLVGVLYSIVYYYTKSIWFSCAIHTAWNFTQNCIFGLPNSGNPAILTVMQPTYTKSSYAYDPEFGVEGTIITTAIQLLTIVLTVIIGEKAKKKSVLEEIK